MLAVLCPGQGAQTPGFLGPWLDVPGVAQRLRWAGAVCGLDLLAAGTTAGAREIRDTALTQPLLVAAALAVWPVLAEADRGPDVLAGHSVGELSAAALAGALGAEAALVLVRERGRAMAEAARRTPTGMAAVLGGDLDAVLARLDALGLVAANRNGAGQVVAAGTLPDLDALASDPPPGARVRPLDVAGAFHTAAMEPAREALAAVAAGVEVRDPRRRVLSNADGAVVAGGGELLRRLVAQVAAPVRWDACQQTLRALGVTAVLELPPAGTLCGLARRELPGVETLALRHPDDLPAACRLLAAHCEPAGEPAPPWRLLVAPSAGTFRPGGLPAGAAVPAGADVGSVVSRHDRRVITTAHAGILLEWLAADGDPVGPGQPLARLHPQEPA